MNSLITLLIAVLLRMNIYTKCESVSRNLDNDVLILIAAKIEKQVAGMRDEEHPERIVWKEAERSAALLCKIK